MSNGNVGIQVPIIGAHPKVKVLRNGREVELSTPLHVAMQEGANATFYVVGGFTKLEAAALQIAQGVVAGSPEGLFNILNCETFAGQIAQAARRVLGACEAEESGRKL